MNELRRENHSARPPPRRPRPVWAAETLTLLLISHNNSRSPTEVGAPSALRRGEGAIFRSGR